jgi:hypothetical protein
MRRCTEALVLIPLLAGCSELLPQVEERGACTLDSVTERVIHSRPLAPDEMIELEAPQVVTLKRNDLDFTPEALLIIEGDQWHHPTGDEGVSKPTVKIVKPDGSRTQTLSQRREDVVWIDYTVNVPGVWTFIVEWELIDCRQVVSVEVLPPD